MQLGNMYFDGERYAEAVTWYEAALKVNPKNVNASTDLGIAYYYSNQPDRALAQFDRSLAIDPKHSKTLLNHGIVRAFGKQDLAGAEKAWQQVLDVAPDSPEAALAKRGLEGIRAAHPTQTGTPPAGEATRGVGVTHGQDDPVGYPDPARRAGVVAAAARRPRRGRISPRDGSGQQGVGLVRDPVCGVFVVPGQALTRRHRHGHEILLFGEVQE